MTPAHPGPSSSPAPHTAAGEADAGPIDLAARARELLSQARAVPSGRATALLHGGSATALRQILLALTEGSALRDHENPGEASLHVLDGRVRLSVTEGEQSTELTAGGLAVVPQARHRVDALTDAVAILTVVPRDRIAATPPARD